MKNKMSPLSRIVIAIASLALIATYFLPVWFIFLIAPQYPEGLTMNIWLDKITGQVDIINGLNHYIGMKHINADMFPEFDYMVYIVGFYILFGLLVAIIGKRGLLVTYLVLLLLGAGAAMYDFYQWGYDYGHNLDPKAAIQVPGLSYQPPLFGHKTLLNFDAYSYPDIGGWFIIGAGLLFFLVWGYEWYKNRKTSKKNARVFNKKAVTISVMACALFFTSCTTKPEPFEIGKDMCEECKMTIMDPKFGAEIITKKGKIYKFDDAHCVVNYVKNGSMKEADIAQTVFSDYTDHKNFIDAKASFFVVSEQLKSPMNSNAASFPSKEIAEQKAKDINGTVKNWEQLYQSL